MIISPPFFFIHHHFFDRVDDIKKLESFEWLRIIPINILQQRTKKIVKYVLEAC